MTVKRVFTNTSISFVQLLFYHPISAHDQADDLIRSDAHMQIGDDLSDDLLVHFGEVFFILRMVVRQVVEQADQEVGLLRRFRVAARDQRHVVVKEGRQPDQLARLDIAQQTEVRRVSVGVGDDGVEEDHADIIGDRLRTDLLQLLRPHPHSRRCRP